MRPPGQLQREPSLSSPRDLRRCSMPPCSPSYPSCSSSIATTARAHLHLRCPVQADTRRRPLLLGSLQAEGLPTAARGCDAHSPRHVDLSRAQKPRRTALGRHPARRRTRRRSFRCRHRYSPRHAARSRARSPLARRASLASVSLLTALASVRSSALDASALSWAAASSAWASVSLAVTSSRRPRRRRAPRRRSEQPDRARHIRLGGSRLLAAGRGCHCGATKMLMSLREMAKPGQEAPLRQTAPVERLAEQTREWFAAAQRDSYERTRIATGLKFMWSLQREAWLRGIAQLVR